jgi:MFS transporter, SP family, sugar:H+ symporter
VYFCIYETKGLSLEQVDELYAKVPSARKSPGFMPTVNFTEVREMSDAGDYRRSTLADLEQSMARRKSSVAVEAEYLHKSNYVPMTGTMG